MFNKLSKKETMALIKQITPASFVMLYRNPEIWEIYKIKYVAGFYGDGIICSNYLRKNPGVKDFEHPNQHTVYLYDIIKIFANAKQANKAARKMTKIMNRYKEQTKEVLLKSQIDIAVLVNSE